MTPVFHAKNYREFIKICLDASKASGVPVTLSMVAEKIGVQKAYLTNVQKGRAELNSDQFSKLCEFFRLNETETEFGDLLLNFDRSVHEKRKKWLQSRIDKLQKEKLKLARDLNTQDQTASESKMLSYYFNPMVKVIHVYLQIEKFSKNPALLTEHLPLSKEQIAQHLRVLRDIGFIEQTKKGIKVIVKGKNLPKDSLICDPHQLQFALKSFDFFQSLSHDVRQNFFVTFMGNKKSRTAIEEAYRDFLSKAQTIVQENSKDLEVAYQMIFLLFPWSTSKNYKI